MKRRSLVILIFLCLIVFACYGNSFAQNEQSNAPFRMGQIVVQANPDTLVGYQIVRILPRSGLVVLEVESGQEWGQVQRFRNRGFKAGVNRIATKFETVPNDTYYDYQWHFNKIQAERAWDISAGENIMVAVLDTGLKTGGYDGIQCISPLGVDIVNNDEDPSDGDGHGTHVSATIAQKTDNGIGVAGLAYRACIMPVKVLDDSGSGSFADIAEGIYYAVDQGASVINMSLGTNARYAITNDPIMDPALDYAYVNAVTVVCASGNDASRKNVSYPAIYPTTIAVGATNFSNNVTRYSNKGTGLDIVAPGGDTSVDLNNDGYGDGVLQETYVNGSWGYYFFQGTSMATPHVTAVAALLLSHGTATNPDEVYDALTSTTLDIGDPGYDSVSGYGLVQAYNALDSSQPPTNTPPIVTILSPSDSQTFNPEDEVLLEGKALDQEDGDLSSLIDWKLDGNYVFTGSQTTIYAPLTEGSHTISATVSDGIATSSSSVTIVVQSASTSSMTVTLTDSGSIVRTAGKNTFVAAFVSVKVTDKDGVPVVGFSLNGQWTGDYNSSVTAVTDETGLAVFQTAEVKYKAKSLSFGFDVTNENIDLVGVFPVTVTYP